MQDEMIPGDSPSFSELLAKVKEDVLEFNDLKIEEDGAIIIPDLIK